MKNKILAFCEILNDNDYVAKYKEIPDEIYCEPERSPESLLETIAESWE